VRAWSDQVAETCMVVPFDRACAADGNVYAAAPLEEVPDLFRERTSEVLFAEGRDAMGQEGTEIPAVRVRMRAAAAPVVLPTATGETPRVKIP
jgi:hypothetical protein